MHSVGCLLCDTGLMISAAKFLLKQLASVFCCFHCPFYLALLWFVVDLQSVSLPAFHSGLSRPIAGKSLSDPSQQGRFYNPKPSDRLTTPTNTPSRATAKHPKWYRGVDIWRHLIQTRPPFCCLLLSRGCGMGSPLDMRLWWPRSLAVFLLRPAKKGPAKKPVCAKTSHLTKPKPPKQQVGLKRLRSRVLRLGDLLKTGSWSQVKVPQHWSGHAKPIKIPLDFSPPACLGPDHQCLTYEACYSMQQLKWGEKLKTVYNMHSMFITSFVIDVLGFY